MRVRRIAVLIDGGYFIKRLPKLTPAQFCTTAKQIGESARYLCKRHVERLVGVNPDGAGDGRWLDHVYRLFYYDAAPYAGVSHHPVRNQRVEFEKSATAVLRNELHTELRRKRKFALRLGHVSGGRNWQLAPRYTKPLIQTLKWVDRIEEVFLDQADPPALEVSEDQQLRRLLAQWREVEANEHAVQLELRQKGVDMRIGLDIASMTLKKQVDTIVLVAGDSDFVPAAKLARREGVEFIVDPMWQKVRDDLYEHVDGIISVMERPVANDRGN